jgi:uncharacterized protein (DUF1330 family)
MEKRMAAYVLVDTEITDPVRYEDYKARAKPIVESFGGRYLVRGGALSVLEGEWQPHRLVVLEFPDVETARRFYDSPEYRSARALRAGAVRMSMVLVEGF